MKEIKNAYVDAEVIDFESTLTTDGSLNMYIQWWHDFENEKRPS